jgi:hypothetical protein
LCDQEFAEDKYDKLVTQRVMEESAQALRDEVGVRFLPCMRYLYNLFVKVTPHKSNHELPAACCLPTSLPEYGAK